MPTPAPARSELGQVAAAFPLWSPWVRSEVVDDRVSLCRRTIRRAGVAATGPAGLAACGSAAAVDRSPLRRSWFELLERAATLEAASDASRRFVLRDARWAEREEVPADLVFPPSPAPERWRFALSNGTALHADRAEACRRAALELAERDRALRAWRGDARPEPVAPPSDVVQELPLDGYDWRACRLPPAGANILDVPAEVAMVVGFPRDPTLSLARGCGAGRSLDAALRRACNEALQGLAFLCDEVVPREEPAPAPSPLYHLDLYLWPGRHERLQRWLDGEHGATGRRAPDGQGELRYVDLTPEPLRGELWIIKALHAEAVPLTFGRAPSDLAGGPAPHPFP